MGMQSHETSDNKPCFGSDEMDYLTKVLAAMQNPVEKATVKMWLEKAREDGLDPQRIYAAAVECRPKHWTPSPPFSDVAPPPKPATSSTSGMLTPSERERLMRKNNELDALLQKAYPTVPILTD